jgi:hypothetical protein
MGVGRRQLLLCASAAGAALLLAPSRARADDVPVPVPLQIKLLAKVAGYDKNLRARAGDKVRVMVVAKPGDSDAQRVSELARATLAEYTEIGDLPVEVVAAPFTTGADLAKVVAQKKLAIVYVCPGLTRPEIEGVGKALAGVSVLTAAATPANVTAGGIVLGFELVSGKPKLVVHLAQAKKQSVALSAEVLKLAKVIE